MQAGQAIKIHNGNYWQTAKFLRYIPNNYGGASCEVQFGEPGKVGYRVEQILQGHVREFIQLPTNENGECIALNEMAERDFSKLVQSLKNALAKLLPNETFIEENSTISAYNGSLTMEPIVMERRTIGQVIEHPGWSVTTWHRIPATRFEPEDISDSVVGEFLHYGQAVQKFVETLFLMHSQDYWNNEADLAMIEKWEQTHDL